MKPVIFFSHSSQDLAAILPIRGRILDGTGNAVEIFMASDGASVPFGRTWLKEIENALRQCKLMFVWMTPASLASDWIPFETGFAYSRGIRVVPIGFQGVRLDDLPPPISILQGFDIVNSKSLNNIIAIINEEFSLTFSDLYDEEFYAANVQDVTSENSPELLRYIRVIDCTYSSINQDGQLLQVRSNWHDILTAILEELKIPFSGDQDEIRGIGFRIDGRTDRDEPRVSVNIDPLALNSTRKAWTLARQRLYDEELPYTFFKPQFLRNVELPHDSSLIGSRLLNSDVSFDTKHPHHIYRFRNIDFSFSLDGSPPKKSLFLLVPTQNDAPIPLHSLIKLFEARHVIKTR